MKSRVSQHAVKSKICTITEVNVEERQEETREVMGFGVCPETTLHVQRICSTEIVRALDLI